jgi:hypothetical protein
MVKALAGHQRPDGSWDPKRGGAITKGEADRPTVYAVTLAALSLQVYYRYLPTYKAEAVKADEDVPEEEDEGDVEIEVI